MNPMSAQNYLGKRYLNLAPTNGGNGKYGFSKNTPILRFDLGNTGVLQTEELRLTGELRVVPNNNNTSTNNTTLATDVNLDPFCGVESVIQSLEISSMGTSNKNLERIDNYNRLCASLYSSLHSKSNYDTQVSHETGAKGNGFTTSTEMIGFENNNVETYSRDGQKIAQKYKWTKVNGDNFSMKLISGVLMSGSIDLEPSGVNGLTIVINLAPDNQVLDGAVANTFHYEIINPRLLCSVMLKSDAMREEQAQIQTGQFNFLTFTSMFNQLSSTDQQIVHKLNLQSVISQFTNYIPTSFLNNFANASLAMYDPAITELTFFKDGQRMPLTYVIEPDLDPTQTDNQKQTTTKPQILLNGLDAFRNYKDIKKSSVNAISSSLVNQQAEVGVFTQGVSYDAVGQNGTPAVVSTLGFNVKSKLANPNNNNAQVPFSAFTFYLNRSSVSVGAGSVQVVQ